MDNDLETAKNETTRLMLLATLCRKNARHEEELQALTRARDMQVGSIIYYTNPINSITRSIL